MRCDVGNKDMGKTKVWSHDWSVEHGWAIKHEAPQLLCCAEVCDESSRFYQFSLLFGIEEISRYEIYEAQINIIRQE